MKTETHFLNIIRTTVTSHLFTDTVSLLLSGVLVSSLSFFVSCTNIADIAADTGVGTVSDSIVASD